MLVQLHLREYDDSDVIAYLEQIEKGVISRTIREALRARMSSEGFRHFGPQTDERLLAPAQPPEAPTKQEDLEQPDPDLMLGQLLGVSDSKSVG
jgi:hypothetical protein